MDKQKPRAAIFLLEKPLAEKKPFRNCKVETARTAKNKVLIPFPLDPLARRGAGIKLFQVTEELTALRSEYHLTHRLATAQASNRFMCLLETKLVTHVGRR